MSRPEVSALVDVDGTLVDSNYHHVLAWSRALRDHGFGVPLYRIHSEMGKGGDQLVPALIGEEADRRVGDAVRAGWREHYDPMLEEVAPLPGARELLVELRRRGCEVVLATSSPTEHLEHFLDLLDARELVDATTDADDVDATKPAPDLLEVARGRASAEHVVALGDSPWDCVAAGRAGLPAIALLTGGFCAAELREAGAVAVFGSLEELRAGLDGTPLGSAAAGGRAG